MHSLPPLNLRPLDLRPGAPRRQLRVQPHQAFAFAGRPPAGKLPPCPEQQAKYIVAKPREAYWRVLVRNEVKGDTSQSIVGSTGHLERSNAWTHLIAAFVSIVYAFVRPSFLSMHSLTAQLGGVSIVTSAIMFGVSTVYHVYNTVPGCAVVARNFDIVAIYFAMGTAATADTSLITNDFANAPYQTLVDPLLAATSLAVYFTLRRYFVPREETSDFMFAEACSLGLFRVFHSDLEHSSLRIAGVGSLTLSFVLMAPAAYANLEEGVAGVWMAGVIVATLLLFSGVVFDNLLGPDRAMAKGETRAAACACCSSKQLGCVMTSHAWWHVISFLGTALMLGAREYGISRIP